MEQCIKCGGSPPAPDGPALDRLDKYLTDPEGGECPGHQTEDSLGRRLGCGAWSRDAYNEADEADERS